MQQKSFRPLFLFILFVIFVFFQNFPACRKNLFKYNGDFSACSKNPSGQWFSLFFVRFVFLFFFKKKRGANAMAAAVARGCGARQERAARFPLVFCLLKKLCFSFLLSLFSFFFKKKRAFLFCCPFFLKKNGTVAGRVRRAGLSRIQMPINPTSVVSPLFVSFLLVMCSV